MTTTSFSFPISTCFFFFNFHSVTNGIGIGIVKDDAIAQLSDQLIGLSTRLQEIERRQQLA
jgi:hypothetical protein